MCRSIPSHLRRHQLPPTTNSDPRRQSRRLKYELPAVRVDLVTDDRRHRSFPLRRIDISRFFPNHKTPNVLKHPPPLSEGRLPSPRRREIHPPETRLRQRTSKLHAPRRSPRRHRRRLGPRPDRRQGDRSPPIRPNVRSSTTLSATPSARSAASPRPRSRPSPSPSAAAASTSYPRHGGDPPRRRPRPLLRGDGTRRP